MSNNPMQRIADLEAQKAALEAKLATQSSEKASSKMKEQQQQPREQYSESADAEELAKAIGARLAQIEENLREGFVVRTSKLLEPVIEKMADRVVHLEERQQALEERFRQHFLELDAYLSEVDKELDAKMVGFSNMLESHHRKTDAVLLSIRHLVRTCETAAAETARAATLCQTFRQDYEETIAQARKNMTSTAKQVEEEIAAFSRSIRQRVNDVMEPLLKRMKRLTSAQLERREKWTLTGFILCAALVLGIFWLASPTASMLRDAARWRELQQGLTPEQAESLNKALKAIEDKNSAKASSYTR